ncbi:MULTISPECIES: Rv0361 family membrane protein [Gordonia]|uniref:Rv0361 family membrane protein n=1 Tax=Gordonia TaxID=2053 RepID=UPI003FA5F28A
MHIRCQPSSLRRARTVVVVTTMTLLLLIAACGTHEETSMPTSTSAEESHVNAAVDRYEHANSHGSRRDILATLTADSPERELLRGSDEAFAERRKQLDAAQYSEKYTNRRDLTITGDTATLTTDYVETRSDGSPTGTPRTLTGQDIEFTLKRVDGEWLIYETTTPALRNDRILQQGPP